MQAYNSIPVSILFHDAIAEYKLRITENELLIADYKNKLRNLNSEYHKLLHSGTYRNAIKSCTIAIRDCRNSIKYLNKAQSKCALTELRISIHV